MIFGIGVDVLEMQRITRTLDKFGVRFIDHLLMPQEREQLARTKRPERLDQFEWTSGSQRPKRPAAATRSN